MREGKSKTRASALMSCWPVRTAHVAFATSAKPTWCGRTSWSTPDIEAAAWADGAAPSARLGLTAWGGQHVVDSQFGLANLGEQAPAEVVRRHDENPITGAMGGGAADRIDAITQHGAVGHPSETMP